MTPAVTPQPEKMSMDDFANSIKTKHPGSYDHLDNVELANRVLAKYPVYRDHVDIKPAQEQPQPVTMQNLTAAYNPEAQKHSIPIRMLDSMGGSILGLPSALYHAAADPMTPEETNDFKGHIRIPGEVTAERLLGRPIVSAGKDYASGKVSLKGAASVLPEALGQGAAAVMAPKLTEGALSAAKAIPVGPMANAMAPKAVALSKVLAKEAISRVPVAGRILHRPSIGDYVGALRTPKGIPATEGIPEVEAAQPETAQHLQRVVSDDAAQRTQAAGKVPRSEGTEEMEALRPESEAKLRSAVGNITPAIETSTKSKLGDLLNNATGGKPLAKGIPLRQQFERVTPTAPKESSVIKSHSYDPNSKEMTVTTHNGQTYVHGDVTPDQAEAFTNADSKGKAWNELRNNSTLVGKVVNGKRVAIKPSQAIKTADPNDLTAILNESLKNVKPKKK